MVDCLKETLQLCVVRILGTIIGLGLVLVVLYAATGSLGNKNINSLSPSEKSATHHPLRMYKRQVTPIEAYASAFNDLKYGTNDVIVRKQDTSKTHNKIDDLIKEYNIVFDSKVDAALFKHYLRLKYERMYAINHIYTGLRSYVRNLLMTRAAELEERKAADTTTTATTTTKPILNKKYKSIAAAAA